MSDHNFEKQIQQKLDELKIPPADSVWSAVQRRIRKDKNRSRGLILFPLVFLLLGVGSYFIFGNNFFDKNKTATLSSSDSKTQPNSPTPNQGNGSTADPIGDSKGIDSGKMPQQPFEPTVARETAEGKPIRPNTKERKTIFSSSSSNDQVVEDKKIIPGNPDRSEKPLKEEPTTDSNSIRNVIRDVVVNQPGTDKEQQANDQRDIGNDATKPGKGVTSSFNDSLADRTIAGNAAPHQQTADSLAGSPATNAVDSALMDSNLSQEKALEKKYKKKKLKWGLDASAGISNINRGSLSTGVFSGQNARVADVTGPSSFNGPILNAPPPVGFKSSPVKKGFSFLAGAFLQADITGRFSISTGLRYNYFSNNVQVGRRVDSSVTVQNTSGSMKLSEYYQSAAATQTNRYTNRYHFVELPLTLRVQLNNSNRLGISWNGGLSLSYLVSTNALHFDSRTGIYYQDNSLFNKLQANFSSGFSVALFSKSSMPVHIGPQVQYGLTNLLQKEVSDSRHLLYFGLNTRFYLKK